jgi:hypothetical protein
MIKDDKLIKLDKYKYDNLKNIVEKSINYTDVCRNLEMSTKCGNRNTIKKYIELHKLDTSHFYIPRKEPKTKIILSDILIENSTYSTYNLKERLYKSKIKERNCEMCGQGEQWNGNKMSLILDHINGVRNDNRIKNLRIVCPNCNATLSTHGGKNIKMKSTKINLSGNDKIKCKCGKLKTYNSKQCAKCNSISQRKVNRPSYVKLVDEIKKLGYKGTGRKYIVSDTTIRKWRKFYEKNS